QSGLLAHDPYVFLQATGELDQYLFSRGVHYRIFDVLGAHLTEHEGVKGVRFAVFAPNAKRVSLVADFNHYDGRVNQMRSLGHSGIFEIFIPGLQKNEKYKFEIKSQDGTIRIKSDPYAFQAEMRPKTASIVTDLLEFKFTDDVWMQKRKEKYKPNKPMLIYEVHLGSWKKKENAFLNYREIAKELSSYCQEMGFTHVEFLPIQEHPLDESWGYQVSGYYAITSRFGSLQDFQWLVNHLHENNIGVLLDWVPGHFPTDDFSLGLFDGTALYEHADEKQGLHPHWTTYVFNYGRYEVSNFLIANALFLFEYMHVDGLRVDAIASMLYLDYGREDDFIRNKQGGNENFEAIEFIKHLNSIVHQKFPDVLMIAEESTSFPGMTRPVTDGGLGFDLKWNMGWMNDTLKYFSRDMLYRTYHQNELTFSLLYAFSEKFVLVLSHDEVVHGKASLIGKMPGDYWQQFANLRLLYSYMICHPGKKLLFMGGEIGQFVEWSSQSEMEWFLLAYEKHQGMQKMVKNLNRLYLNSPALYEDDFSSQGFEWVDFSDTKNSIISYLRKSAHGIFLCVHNFTPLFHTDYAIKLAHIASITEVFNSDASLYGGSDKINQRPKIEFDKNHHATGIKIEVAPLATMIFKVAFSSLP
ncbi:MAG TPA: 1,4-alpha-glucan branching protein GlgB, partial [Parachlamydiaceae bacterium]|nr:1,4-alpha-glucan branching protein GlgB [Parachlamydiaceae bacterium]